MAKPRVLLLLEEILDTKTVADVVADLENVELGKKQTVLQLDSSSVTDGKLLISHLEKRLERDRDSVTSVLEKGLSYIESKAALARLQAHSSSIPIDRVIHRLVSEQIINVEEKEEILCLQTTLQRGGKLMDILDGKGGRVVVVAKVLYGILVDVQYAHLAKVMFPKEFRDEDDSRAGVYEVMTEAHKELLNTNRSAIIETIDPETVLHHLSISDPINQHYQETIVKEKTKMNQAASLLDYVRSKSEFTFNAFVAALNTCGYVDLVDRLDESVRKSREEAAAAALLVNDMVGSEGGECEVGTDAGRVNGEEDCLRAVDAQVTGTNPTSYLSYMRQTQDTQPFIPPSERNQLLQREQTNTTTVGRTRVTPLHQATSPHVAAASSHSEPSLVVTGRGNDVCLSRNEVLSQLQPISDELVEDIEVFVKQAIESLQWTYGVLWVVPSPEDFIAVAKILEEHCDVVEREASHALIRLLQCDIKIMFIDRTNIRKLIILAGQKQEGLTYTAEVCSLLMQKCSAIHMAVMSGTCSGMPLETELGDIIIASSAFTTDVGAIIKSENDRMRNVEVSGCQKLHLQVLQHRLQHPLQQGRFLWQEKDSCVCKRPQSTKEYQLLLLSRVLIELDRKVNRKWLEKFGLNPDEDLLSDDNWDAIERICPTLPEFAQEAKDCYLWVIDDRDDAPYGCKPCDELRDQILKQLKTNRNYPTKPRDYPDYQCKPIHTMVCERRDGRRVFEEAREIKNKCIAVDKEAAKFYEIASERLGRKPYFVVKGVADFADGKMRDKAFETYARQISAVLLLDVIRMFAEAEQKNQQQKFTRQHYTDL